MNSIDRSTDTRVAEVRVPIAAVKGRGTNSRFPHRFASDSREGFDDGWEQDGEEGAAPPRTRRSSSGHARLFTASAGGKCLKQVEVDFVRQRMF